MAIRTTTIGAWWEPPDHAEDLARYHRGELPGEAGEQVLRAAAATAIREQRELGLDEWTGGEYFAFKFISRIHEVLTGVEVDRPEAELIVDYDDTAHATIVGDIDAPEGLGYARAYLRERDLPGGVRKATVVGPFELVPFGQDQPDAVREQMPNLLRLVNEEIRALAAAGCPHVQLDVPFLGLLVNTGQMSAADAAGIIAACFEGVDGPIRGIHICCGTAAGKPACPVLRNAPWLDILRHLEGVVDVAAFECSYFPQYLERDAYRDLPAGMQLAAGIVSEASYMVEPVAKLRARIEDWARVVGEERLWVSANCGFAGHPARDIPVLRAKLEHLVEAAAAV